MKTFFLSSLLFSSFSLLSANYMVDINVTVDNKNVFSPSFIVRLNETATMITGEDFEASVLVNENKDDTLAVSLDVRANDFQLAPKISAEPGKLVTIQTEEGKVYLVVSPYLEK
ncbi:hypothetical protein [Algicola sagamiensis]|uniref:hypothetical protein n=1 Tax=Algicola sagamiensis TaxID=163869 RepID=UPI00036B77DC|nr:hypothetical protein [Algicola sagamiensis]